jgi:predicted O-methyltransferase YrrM
MFYFIRDCIFSSFYRNNPGEILQLVRAKLKLRQFRCSTVNQFLGRHGISPQQCEGLSAWSEDIAAMRKSLYDAGLGQGGVSEEDGSILYSLVRALCPSVVVETGIAAGVSSSYLAAALVDNGEGDMYSIDLPAESVATSPMADGSCYNWQKHGVGWAIPPRILELLGARRHVLLGDVRQILPRLLQNLGTIDFFFHDDLHTPDHMLWEYSLVWPYLRNGGALVSDDCNAGWVTFVKRNSLGDLALTNVQNLALARK